MEPGLPQVYQRWTHTDNAMMPYVRRVYPPRPCGGIHAAYSCCKGAAPSDPAGRPTGQVIWHPDRSPRSLTRLFLPRKIHHRQAVTTRHQTANRLHLGPNLGICQRHSPDWLRWCICCLVRHTRRKAESRDPTPTLTHRPCLHGPLRSDKSGPRAPFRECSANRKPQDSSASVVGGR